MAGLLELMQERQQRLAGARPNSIAGLLGQVGTYPGENLASMARQQITSIPQKLEQNQRYQMGLLEQAFPGSTYESMMTQGDPKALAELAMQVPLNAMVAYHGTPHNIAGKFDINKVGTGEGAQAYGHGMYFAENPAVATDYANKLGYDYKYMGKTPKENSPTDLALRWLKNLDWDKEAAKSQWKNEGLGAKVIQAIDKIDLEKVQKPGNLYKVDIPDEYIPNMLDWDKPISQQSKEVKKALAPYIEQYGLPMDEPGRSAHSMILDIIGKREGLGSGSSPKSFQALAPQVAEELNKIGIKGIRYLDQGSRNGTKATSNFVVFDPTDVKILEKNNQKVEGLLD